MRKYPIYAPVMIPTLCRFEHFKRCVDSLSRCTGAEYTELYIGLDYPAKESHWEGYRKICDYVEQITGFENVIVLKRDYNYGVSANIRDLATHIKQKYDRYIFSEDDNEFAPNFLEYMNAGLERYKDDPNVIRICGCLMPWDADYEGCMETYPYNAFPALDYNGLGTGQWFAKTCPIPFTKDSILQSFVMTHKVFRYGYCLAIDRFLHQLHKDSQLPDVCRRLYCAFNHKYCIFPRVSKVKNWGYDGSGLNSDNNEHWIEVQTLDTASTFDFDDFEIRDYNEVKEFVSQMYDKPIKHPHIRRWVMKEYLFYRITGLRIEDKPEGKSSKSFFIRSVLSKISFGLIKVR